MISDQTFWTIVWPLVVAVICGGGGLWLARHL